MAWYFLLHTVSFLILFQGFSFVTRIKRLVLRLDNGINLVAISVLERALIELTNLREKTEKNKRPTTHTMILWDGKTYLIYYYHNKVVFHPKICNNLP